MAVTEQEIEAIVQQAKNAVESADNARIIDQIRIDFLGKQGQLTQFLKRLGTLPPEERPVMGALVNAAKLQLKQCVSERLLQIETQHDQLRVEQERCDVTLPGVAPTMGARHPITQMTERCVDLLTSCGFTYVSGSQIETPYYNFEALNIPEHHPARQACDTFYFGDGRLLRTHTSSVQMHALAKHHPPLQLMSTGPVYRRDFDQTHTPMFHQLEGLVVAKDCHFGHLKYLVDQFLSGVFGRQVTLRLRPSYFPFTEPSAEVDIQHFSCEGRGCRTCSDTGWLEVLGCGMVHPEVLRRAGIDPDQYTGYAFGVGIDRLAMLCFGIDDLRSMFDNDLRFLEQFT